MADDKRGREKQARDADRRQQERNVATDLKRQDETEPPDAPEALTDLDAELESLDFPATGAEIVVEIGDQTVEADGESYTVEELIPETDTETFDSPAAVRVRVERPTIAAAMKRFVEATETLQNTDLRGSQRNGYEMTLRVLKAIEPDDDDEGIQVISDWIVEYIHSKEKLPSSRAVRRQAAKFCRTNGYEVRNDEWLGI